MSRYIIEAQSVVARDGWFPVARCGAFKSLAKAEDELNFLRGRAQSSEYRIRDTRAEAESPRALTPEPVRSRTNWRGTIFLVRKDFGEYWDAFAQQYPEVNRQIDRVTSFAGTSDADAKVLHAAGGLLADLQDWSLRARVAMLKRDAKKFDTLAAELRDIIGSDEVDRPRSKAGAP